MTASAPQPSQVDPVLAGPRGGWAPAIGASVRIIGYNAHVPEPRFIVHLDDRSMEVEPVDRPTTFEGYDISAVEAFLLSGERLRPITDGLEWGSVAWTTTG